MDFEPRLSILRQAGMLSDEDYQKVQDVIRYFQEKYNLTLTEENASSMITHLCAALGRIQRGEPVEPLDEGVYENKRRACFPQGSGSNAGNCPGHPARSAGERAEVPYDAHWGSAGTGVTAFEI